MAECNCDVFQFCRCLRSVGNLMIVLVLSFVALTAYSVAVCTTAQLAASTPAAAKVCAAAACMIFIALVIMLLWSYFACVFTSPGTVPAGWHPFADEDEAQLQLARLRLGGRATARGPAREFSRPRYCRKCREWKPERAHHCSMSGHCVLRMDHYCVWVLNCVGLLNYKFFLLFLWYTFWACLVAECLMLGTFASFFTQEQELSGTQPVLIFLAFVIDAAFCLSLLGFMMMHARMVVRNKTTIEMYEKRWLGDRWPYDKGTRRNIEEVFGSVAWRWFVPVHTKDERQALLSNALKKFEQPAEDDTVPLQANMV